MNTPTKTKTTWTRHEYRVASPYGARWPATVRDLQDAVRVALQDLAAVKGARHAEADDGLLWFVDDDGIVLYFETSEQTS